MKLSKSFWMAVAVIIATTVAVNVQLRRNFDHEQEAKLRADQTTASGIETSLSSLEEDESIISWAAEINPEKDYFLKMWKLPISVDSMQLDANVEPEASILKILNEKFPDGFPASETGLIFKLGLTKKDNVQKLTCRLIKERRV